MPLRKKNGGGRATRNNSKQLATVGASQKSNRRPKGLPSQYTFTPMNPHGTTNVSQESHVPVFQPATNPTVRDYPPPRNLFQPARSYPGASPADEARRGGPQHLASTSNTPPLSNQPSVFNQHVYSNQPRPSSQARGSMSHHSSQVQNSHEEEDDESGSEEDAAAEPTLPEDQLATLYELLRVPGRELYTTVLSPKLEPGTTWFGNDRSALTRKITKVFTNKFDGPFYSWGCVPLKKKKRDTSLNLRKWNWEDLQLLVKFLSGLIPKRMEHLLMRKLKKFMRHIRRTRKLSWLHSRMRRLLTSTFTNDRGAYFGVGSLGDYINGKRKYPGSTSSFTTSLHQQLEEATRKMEEQAAIQAEREAEASRVLVEQQAEIKHSKLVKKYLSKTDPNFLAFINSESSADE
ncbi:uncharacterized protein LOC111832407 [Capsella rubella]|uniref:uncharacterized protein LOC111832407 n=1 Tax=Capsella rubella TaxID=81985 RepID=UPI000CD520FE|nr:uncharacterized protein LOC111832407 [Capsella rubella]